MLRTAGFASLAITQVLWAAPTPRNQPCFPYGGLALPTDGSAPSMSLEDWWCPQSMAYGFQGFSYPMENPDCDAYENTLDQMDADFAQMKRDFGASIVRMYYPVCTEAFIFERALQAAINNNMALIFQVWTNFGVGTVWEDSRQAMYDTLNNDTWKDIAPYVVHWADFGSEPVGDEMDGGREQFVEDLGKFRAFMNERGILAGISEDWDRPGIMRTTANGTTGLGEGLGPIGEGVRNNSDYAHIHPMPYYHFNDPESEAWPYIQNETLWVQQYTGLPVTITETQWSWATNFHNPSKSDVGLGQYNQYWKTFDAECEWFKANNVGWFFHSWRGEDSFDIMYANGDYVIANGWRPKTC